MMQRALQITKEKRDYLINDAGIIDYLENMRLDMEKCEIRYIIPQINSRLIKDLTKKS